MRAGRGKGGSQEGQEVKGEAALGGEKRKRKKQDKEEEGSGKKKRLER